MCHVPRWERPGGGASPDAQSCPKRRLGQFFSAATHAAGGGRYSVYLRTQWVFLQAESAPETCRLGDTRARGISDATCPTRNQNLPES